MPGEEGSEDSAEDKEDSGLLGKCCFPHRDRARVIMTIPRAKHVGSGSPPSHRKLFFKIFSSKNGVLYSLLSVYQYFQEYLPGSRINQLNGIRPNSNWF